MMYVRRSSFLILAWGPAQGDRIEHVAEFTDKAVARKMLEHAGAPDEDTSLAALNL